jgi:N-acetylglucosaminyldiphosphoundecaprenol N-acetyl-beta-D-mannosaminyltransferase
MVDKIVIANIPIHRLTVDDLHDRIERTIVNNEKKLFLHANARLVELANTSEKWLQDFFKNQVEYVMCDGSGIQLAAKLTGQPVPEKIAYNIWIWRFIKFTAEKKFSIYFLGAKESTLLEAIKKAKEFAPNVTIVGHHHGFFDKKKNSPQNKVVIDYIRRANPDILFVGFGMPVQEHWIKENLDQLQAKCIFSCGGAFDFISGNKSVAPAIFRKLYLEWLYRFMLEPTRLLSRVTVSNMTFLKVVFQNLSRDRRLAKETFNVF